MTHSSQQRKAVRRAGRRARVRKKVLGTAARPRLSVFRSNRAMVVQIIDDTQGHTLAYATSRGLNEGSDKNMDAAAALGKKIAEVAQTAGITEVVFDKGWYRYHGRVKALADAARDAGLKF